MTVLNGWINADRPLRIDSMPSVGAVFRGSYGLVFGALALCGCAEVPPTADDFKRVMQLALTELPPIPDAAMLSMPYCVDPMLREPAFLPEREAFRLGTSKWPARLNWYLTNRLDPLDDSAHTNATRGSRSDGVIVEHLILSQPEPSMITRIETLQLPLKARFGSAANCPMHVSYSQPEIYDDRAYVAILSLAKNGQARREIRAFVNLRDIGSLKRAGWQRTITAAQPLTQSAGVTQ